MDLKQFLNGNNRERERDREGDAGGVYIYYTALYLCKDI